LKGDILSITHDGGIVLGEDGERYTLVSMYSKDNQKLLVGSKIDFIPSENHTANDVYILKSNAGLGVGDGTARSAATIATIGAGLGLLSAVPGIGFLFAIGGMITELIGVKKLADMASEPKIFNDMLWGTLAGIVGIIVMTIGGFIGLGMSVATSSVGGIGVTVVLVFLIGFGFAIYSIVKIFKALKGLGRVYTVNILSISAWLYAIGMILVPVGIGYFVLVGYFITKIIGYLSIK
jgi:uncharacterized membrane protein